MHVTIQNVLKLIKIIREVILRILHFKFHGYIILKVYFSLVFHKTNYICYTCFVIVFFPRTRQFNTH